jgi:hypothetical protein
VIAEEKSKKKKGNKEDELGRILCAGQETALCGKLMLHVFTCMPRDVEAT